MAKAKTNPDDDVDRTYFEIAPAAEAADPDRLQDAFRRLHTQRGAVQLECLVVARGDGVAYYVGTDAEHARTVDHTLHSIFPDVRAEGRCLCGSLFGLVSSFVDMRALCWNGDNVPVGGI